LSCEFQQQQQQQHPQLGDDDISCDDDDDDDELCYSGALDDHGPVDVPMSRPLVADRRRQPGSAATVPPPSDAAVAAARTHRCFNQHAVFASR